MRRLAAVLLGAALLAGAAQAKEPRRAHTPAGTAKAKAVVLKLPDLPAGWKIDPSAGDDDGDFTCPGFDPDQSDLTEVGDAEASFERRDGLAFVLSGATVFATPAQARTAWARVVRPQMVSCVARAFAAGATGPTTKTKVLSTGRLALAARAPRKAAYRIVADVVTGGQHIRAYFDLILLGGGRVNAATFVSTVLVPPPAAFERSLAAKVAGRL